MERYSHQILRHMTFQEQDEFNTSAHYRCNAVTMTRNAGTEENCGGLGTRLGRGSTIIES